MAVAEESEFKTLGDVFTYVPDGAPIFENVCICAFEKDGTWYRAEADVPAELIAKIDALEWTEDYDDQVRALLRDLPVTKVIVLSDYLLSTADLDALVGKTGQELLDMGFEQGMGYNFWDKAEFYLTKDLFEYHVYFNEKVPEMEDYDAVLDEILASLTVEKAEIDGFAGACSDPNLIW